MQCGHQGLLPPPAAESRGDQAGNSAAYHGHIAVGDEISLDTALFIRLDQSPSAKVQLIPVTETTLAELKKKLLAL
jgi:hypothetical protein